MSDALKKRKSKVLRNEGGTPEMMKRGRGEGDQQVRTHRPRGTERRRVCVCGDSQQKDWRQEKPRPDKVSLSNVAEI